MLETVTISTSALFRLAEDAVKNWVDPSLLVMRNCPHALVNLGPPAMAMAPLLEVGGSQINLTSARIQRA